MSRIYHETSNTESIEPNSRISPNTWGLAENTLFQWGPSNFSKYHRGKVSL